LKVFDWWLWGLTNFHARTRCLDWNSFAVLTIWTFQYYYSYCSSNRCRLLELFSIFAWNSHKFYVFGLLKFKNVSKNLKIRSNTTKIIQNSKFQFKASEKNNSKVKNERVKKYKWNPCTRMVNYLRNCLKFKQKYKKLRKKWIKNLVRFLIIIKDI
jgi:hypothetical protein